MTRISNTHLTIHRYTHRYNFLKRRFSVTSFYTMDGLAKYHIFLHNYISNVDSIRPEMGTVSRRCNEGAMSGSFAEE